MIRQAFNIKLKEAYVYIHRKESTGEIFYVGKGRNYRWKSVLRSSHWKNIARKHGVYCEIVGNSLTDHEALLLEAYLISQFGRFSDGGTLVNLTQGGEGMRGYVHSDESKAKISAIHTGKSVSAATKQRIKEGALRRVRTQEDLNQLANARSLLARPVLCRETGAIYPSAKDAARAIGGDHSCIIKVCLGKRKQHKKLTWEYHGRYLTI